MTSETYDCIVVGAGAAGLTSAGILQGNGRNVLVVDKGRGVGGRMATRRIGEHRFDHGAPVLFGVSREFESLLSDRLDDSLLRPCSFIPHPPESPVTYGPFVGVGGMSAIAKSLAEGLTVHTAVRIRSVGWANGVWRLASELGREYIARSIIMTPPVPQILELLHNSGLTLPPPADLSLRKVEYEPCLALMVVVDPTAYRLEETFTDPARGSVELLVDNHAKGVSAQAGAVSLHAKSEFSRAMFQESDEDIARQMLDDVRGYIDVSQVTWQLHRWRYSRAVVRSPEPFLSIDDPGLMFFAGDGFGAGDIEGAVCSGRRTAEELLRRGL